ncbi:MAG: helix-turn-helix transcriptional regulator [Candidatus Paceibacterota bacterium]|nr:MAG: helix-turn-helix transcriptional regulator [Candidatus Paceibacterota bacterium]
MSNIKKQLGQKIKELRLEAGISQEKLATKAKLHRTYMSDIERGERNVSVENIKKISDALDVDPDELLRFK